MPESARFRFKTKLLITLLLLSTFLLVQTVRSVPLSSQSLMKGPSPMNPSGSMVDYSNSTSTAATNGPVPADWPSWRTQVSRIPTPQAGCFTVAYPSTIWQPTQCTTAPSLPLQPSPATVGGSTSNTVGDGNDEVAQSPGTIIGSSIGTLLTVGVTSEIDVCVGPPPFCTSGGEGANAYGLQVNSQFPFTTSTTYTDGRTAHGWEQFVYVTDPSNAFVTGTYIQYWLIGYHSTYGVCPNTAPPGGGFNGSPWANFGNDCVSNSPITLTPQEPATSLTSLSLAGYANIGSNDEVLFCVSGGSCYSVTVTEHVLNLYLNWIDSEFNVFGYGDGSQAQFNTGTTITVTNTLKDQGGSVISPSCVNTGYTGETNNLNLGSCTPNGISGQIVFSESKPPTVIFNTNPTSFVGSSPPGSISACSGSFTNGESSQNCGAGFSATANSPSSPVGWQFDHWTWTGGVSCIGSNTNNPITCAVTNDGSLTAAFRAQVTFHISPALTVIGWGACAGSNEADGAMMYFTNFGTVSACYVPIGYSVSSWVCTSGLSCSGSSDVTPVTFAGPGTITLNLQSGSISSPAQTNITAFPSTSTPTHGTMFTVSGQLRLISSGVGVGNEPIECVFSWSTSIVTVMTQTGGSLGLYSCNVTAPATTGPYDVDVFFLGDYSVNPQYLPCKATTMTTVT